MAFLALCSVTLDVQSFTVEIPPNNIDEYYKSLQDLQDVLSDELNILQKPFVDIKNTRKIATILKNQKGRFMVLSGMTFGDPDTTPFEITVFDPSNPDKVLGTIDHDKLISELMNYKSREDRDRLKSLINETKRLATLKQYSLLKNADPYLRNRVGEDMYQRVGDRASWLLDEVTNNRIKSVSALDNEIQSIKDEFKKAALLFPDLKQDEANFYKFLEDIRTCFTKRTSCRAIGRSK